MDKFFLGNTTIIEPTYSFYNNDITKNAIIFIDEFDATRDRLLNQIITRGLENHIDYLGLFHRVYASLKTRDFPAELTTASKLQQTYLDEHKNAKNPMEIIEKFGGVFDETYDRFAMQYSFKTEEDGKGDNGKLRIVFGERSYIRDNDSEKLEDRLGDILVTLYEKAEENRIVREAREEAERKRVEEERRREENRQRKEQEIRLVKELVNKSEDYRIAKEIREYIQAMIDSGNEDIT